ncbi:MAG TPA: DMT family transporter, partial [Anaerovoracaceae bacterium]|nr:DMT family transporter [Anaerovoracaceae bacterium]
MKQHTYGYIYAILAAFFYALVAVVAKNLIIGGTHPFQVTFYQYIFSISILGTWIFIRKPGAFRCSAKKIGSFALLGMIGGASTNMLFYSALQYLDAGISSMLLFLHPVFITIFFGVTKIKAMKPINYVSVVIAAFGTAVVL